MDGNRSTPLKDEPESSGGTPSTEGGTIAEGKFKPWNEDTADVQSFGVIGGQTVLKKEQVKAGERIVVKPQALPEPDRDPIVVTPIVEDDAIVGLQVSCSCGAEHEVRFEFDRNE